MDSLERMPFKLKQAIFEKLKEVTDVASLSKEERIKYDNSVKIYRDYLVTMEFEKQEREAAKQKIEAAKQEGVAIGEARGERHKALSIARSMKLLGNMDIETIAQLTGLSTAEVAEL